MARARRVARIVAACALCGTAALVATACGGGSSGKGTAATAASTSSTVAASATEASRSAPQILADAKAAARAAGSVHIAGHIPTSGETVDLDMALVAGRGATGTIAVNGTPVGVTQIGDTLYLKAGPGFLRAVGAPKAAVQLLAGRWFKAPTQGAQAASLSSLRQLTDMHRLVDRVLTPGSHVTKGGTGAVSGTPTVVLKDADGSLDVSLRGPPYPLRVRPRQGAGEVVFSRWDRPVALAAPAGAVDLSGAG